jgi:hypothetical protein
MDGRSHLKSRWHGCRGCGSFLLQKPFISTREAGFVLLGSEWTGKLLCKHSVVDVHA